MVGLVNIITEAARVCLLPRMGAPPIHRCCPTTARDYIRLVRIHPP